MPIFVDSFVSFPVVSGATVPGVPTNLHLAQEMEVDIDVWELILAWDAPASDGGSAITSYDYSIDDGASVLGSTPNLQTNPFEIFAPGTFNMRARAINAIGAGAWSTALAVVE